MAKVRLVVLLFTYLLIENILEQHLPYLNYTDEIITLFALMGIFLLNRKLVINKYERRMVLATIALITAGLSGNIIFKIQNSSIAIWKDILTLIKFFMVYLFCTVTYRKGISGRCFKKTVIISKFYCIVLALSGIVSQFTDLGMINERSILFFKSYVFLYSHETFLVTTVVVMLSILISDDVKKHRSGIISGGTVLFLSMRTKSIVFVLVVAGMFLFFRGRASIRAYIKNHKLKTGFFALFMMGLVYCFTRDKIATYVSYGLSAARPALYIVAFRVMRDYFPAGTGFGTFASYLSVKYDSPLYHLYGIANVSGLSQYDNYAYVSDTFWPYIMAQFGLIGSLLYFYMIFCVLRNIIRMYSGRKNIFIASVALFAYAIAACFVESFLTNASVILVAITLGLILNHAEYEE